MLRDPVLEDSRDRKQFTRPRIARRVERVRPFREEEQPSEGPQRLAGAGRALEKWRRGQKGVGGTFAETTRSCSDRQ